jgi:hypothetical protein
VPTERAATIYGTPDVSCPGDGLENSEADMMKLLRVKRLQIIWRLAPLLVVYAPICAAQAGDCTAAVKIVSIGVQNPDDTRMRNRTVRLYRYRIDATSSEKQCAAINFNIRRNYKLPDGSPFTATEPGSIRIRSGKGSDFGELAEKRELPKIEWSAEDISCRRC